MKLAHTAIWTTDIERAKAFYEKYFNAVASEKYTNPLKRFQSYFLSFGGDAQLEIMSKEGIDAPNREVDFGIGFAHIAFCMGDRSMVDELTRKLELDGFDIVGKPRLTGDGHYESVVLDCDGNVVEITD